MVSRCLRSDTIYVLVNRGNKKRHLNSLTSKFRVFLSTVQYFIFLLENVTNASSGFTPEIGDRNDTLAKSRYGSRPHVAKHERRPNCLDIINILAKMTSCGTFMSSDHSILEGIGVLEHETTSSDPVIGIMLSLELKKPSPPQ